MQDERRRKDFLGLDAPQSLYMKIGKLKGDMNWIIRSFTKSFPAFALLDSGIDGLMDQFLEARCTDVDLLWFSVLPIYCVGQSGEGITSVTFSDQMRCLKQVDV